MEVDVLGGSVAYLAAIPAVLAVLAMRLGTWRTIVALIAVAHLVILASFALFPLPVDPALIAGGRGFASHTAGEALNVVPFRTIAAQLVGRYGTEGRLEALLNLFVLTPAGVYLPILVPRLRTWRAFVPAAIVLGGSIEAAQLAISLVIGFRYRTIDVDDWILNTVGLLIGFAVWQLLSMVASRRNRHARATSATGAIGG
jgi:glycopeptide antibiotics resistance protein